MFVMQAFSLRWHNYSHSEREVRPLFAGKPRPDYNVYYTGKSAMFEEKLGVAIMKYLPYPKPGEFDR